MTEGSGKRIVAIRTEREKGKFGLFEHRTEQN